MRMRILLGILTILAIGGNAIVGIRAVKGYMARQQAIDEKLDQLIREARAANARHDAAHAKAQKDLDELFR